MCPVAEEPDNGYITKDSIATRDVGNMVKFHCDAGFMMIGHPVSTCDLSGVWSTPTPRCVKACTYPGGLIGGQIFGEVKFYYHIGETVEFNCLLGLKMLGARRIVCLKSGSWSGAVPLCVREHEDSAQHTSDSI